MNILITGVAGLLGSRLADWIIEKRPFDNVIGIDDFSGGYKENINNKVNFFRCDCISSSDIEHIFNETNPDIVYHFAAYAAEGLSPFIRKYNYKNNLVATANIVNQCIKKKVKRLVFTSSMAVYGKGNPPFYENDTPRPIDPYGIAKYAAEMDIQVAGNQHGLDWCIIRPHNVYGKKQNIWDKYRNVLGIWMYQYLNNQPMTIFGDGLQRRAFSCIDDCLEPLWNAGFYDKASKQIINLGSSVYYTIKEANDILKKVMEGGETKFLENRHEVKNAHPSWEKSIEILEFEDNIDLETGLRDMWNWAKQQPKRERFKWSKYELDEGIYSYWKPGVTF